MLNEPNVATPPTAASAVGPASVAPLIPVTGEIATVTVPVKLGTGLPAASTAVTCTAGVMVPPAAVLVGFTVNDSLAAGPNVMSKGVLVAGASPVALAVSVYPLPRAPMRSL